MARRCQAWQDEAGIYNLQLGMDRPGVVRQVMAWRGKAGEHMTTIRRTNLQTGVVTVQELTEDDIKAIQHLAYKRDGQYPLKHRDRSGEIADSIAGRTEPTE